MAGMSNHRVGRLGALVCGAAVAAFALSMLVNLVTGADTVFWSCLFSMFIALGYLVFAAGALGTNRDEKNRGAAAAGVALAAVYAVIILLVYYAECTTVRMNQNLSEEALSIIKYSQLGSLFFNYDLLGYGIMGLSTFFLSFVILPDTKGGRWLRGLLRAHGVFFVPCFIMPMLPVFTPGTSALVGTLLLEVWCAYFLPVCCLGWRYFQRNKSGMEE